MRVEDAIRDRKGQVYLSAVDCRHINHVTYTSDVFQQVNNVLFKLLDSILHTIYTTTI